MMSSAAYKHLHKLYESARINLDTRENEIDSEASATTTVESFSGHHLPKAALEILQGNRSQQQQQQVRSNKNDGAGRSREKIDSITRDLSNVDLD